MSMIQYFLYGMAGGVPEYFHQHMWIPEYIKCGLGAISIVNNRFKTLLLIELERFMFNTKQVYNFLSTHQYKAHIYFCK